MIHEMLMRLGLGDGSLNADVATRRKHQRHIGQGADVVFEGRVCPLKDWSFSGISFRPDETRRLRHGETVNFVLQFRFPYETIKVHQMGEVVRSGHAGVAASFKPDAAAERQLMRVLDHQHAQDFLASQVA